MSIEAIREFVRSGIIRQNTIPYEDAVLTMTYWNKAEGVYLVLWLVIKPCSERNEWCHVEGVRSTGFMGRLMTDIEQVASENRMHIGIGNVYNEFLQPWFIRRGYTEIPDPTPANPMPCYYILCSGIVTKRLMEKGGTN